MTDDEIIQALNISIAELEEMKQADKEIDRGAKLFELDTELKAGAKKARQAERKAPATSTRKPKTVNNEKIDIINRFIESVSDVAENVDVINPERMFSFTVSGTKYKITMSVPRS